VTETESKPPVDFPELESGGAGAPADEFANIPSPPRRRHPALALAATALAVFLLYQILDDVFFALSHTEARDIGDARALAVTSPDKLPINEFVRMSGMADRESGVIIDTAGSWRFTQFFRLFGTGSRVFVSRVPDPIPVEQAEKDVFIGRLVRFSDLSFQAAIRKHFANRVTATHFFVPAAVRDKVQTTGGGPLVMPDMLGEQVSLAPNDELSIDAARPADVQVDLPRKKYPDVAAARAAIEQQGGKVLDEEVKATDIKSIALVMTFPADKRDQVMNAISELDMTVRFRPLRTTHTVRITDLTASKDALLIKTTAGSKELPLDQIVVIRTMANVQIPADAILLREGERPRDHIKVLIAVVFLLGFAVVNLLALRARA
jgi:hypothetical protein